METATLPLRRFRDGDTVVFLGDSITHGGLFHKYLQDFWLTRHPRAAVRFRNVGVSGDTSAGGLDRIPLAVLPYHPTFVFTMFGMNDHGDGTGIPDQRTPEQEKRFADRAAAYRKNLGEIVARLRRETPAPDLAFATGTPYDDRVLIPGSPVPEKCVGRQDSMHRLAEEARRLAREQAIPVVDFDRTFTAFLHAQQAADPAYTAIGTDRTHPTANGHLFMAREILAAQGESALVSSVDLSVAPSTPCHAENTALSDLDRTGGGLSFTLTEEALPFPIDPAAADMAARLRFTDEWSHQILAVHGLPAESRMRLSIDGEPIGTWQASDWDRGINLAEFPTPQAVQARRVAEASSEKRSFEERRFCNPYFIRLFCQWTGRDPHDGAGLLAEYEKAKDKNDYTMAMIPTYAEYRDRLSEVPAELDRLDAECRRLAHPVPHRYELRLVP